jgi:hypothetical protein
MSIMRLEQMLTAAWWLLWAASAWMPVFRAAVQLNRALGRQYRRRK